MKKLENITKESFEAIKHTDKTGMEFWYARELMKVLKYTKWENFKKVIEKAKIACNLSNNATNEHFPDIRKALTTGNNAVMYVEDCMLTRYACYLIVQNADARKKEVALGQTYFAIQTRKMELTEAEYNTLSEDEKRLYRRRQTRDGNKILYKIARKKGVKNFDLFTNAGYKGLYNGETANDIAKRKGLRYREDILDNMGSVELGANIFRITQTEALLEKQAEPNEKQAIDTHYNVGLVVREAIEKLGGTMPEELPTPKKSIKELEKEELMKLKGGGIYPILSIQNLRKRKNWSF